MYYRRPPKKNIFSYILPFFVIGLIFAAIVFGWRTLNNTFIDQGRNSYSGKVYLNIEGGSAKAMTVGKSEWQNAPDKIYLYRGERVKTGMDGRATLTHFDQSIMRLNTNTEVGFANLKQKSDIYNIEVELSKGDVWAKIEPISNPNSNFSITTDLLTIDTLGATVAVSSPGTVYMIEGNAQIGVKYDDEVIKTYNLGVGQQFIASQSAVQSVKRGDSVDVVFALSDQFKRTNWYRWNTKKDGAISAFEESDVIPSLDEELESMSDDEEAEGAESHPRDDDDETESSEDLANADRLVYVTKPSNNIETSKSIISIQGNYDEENIEMVYVNGKEAIITNPGKWKMESIKLLLEGENKIDIEAEDVSGKKYDIEPLLITYDKTAPDMPVVTDPVAEGEVVEIDDVEKEIKGTVSEDTQAVIINDYRLAKYVPGSKEFKYYAKVEYGNLEVGENEFKIYAEDKAGNTSEPAIIILELPEDVIENAELTSDDEETTETTGAESVGANQDLSHDDTEAEPLTQSSTGGVEIISPNGGESFETKETEFEINGIVPEGTAKVEVNDYKLSLFEQGDTEFKYRAYKSIGNLVIGEKNEYVINAYNDSDELIGSASIIIDVESGASAAPVITMPSDTGSYSTSLDTLVLGGTVGKWVTRVYVNDKEIREYIPGSEKWRETVELSPGKNTFTVTAEKAGNKVGESSIEINYQ